MSNTINKLQVRVSQFDSTRMTDLNHWSKTLALKPEVFTESHRLLFASQTNHVDLSNNNMIEGIFGLGKTKYIDSLSWGWGNKVQGFRPMTIIENRTPGNTPGRYGQEIVVVVDVNLGTIGESWSPGSSDKSQIAIITDIQAEGANYVYKLKAYTDGPDHYINPEYLIPGSKWTRMYAMRGEAAETGGHTETTTDIEYSNNLVKLRKEYKVTDFAAQAVLEIALVDSEGNTHVSWMDMQEAEYHKAMAKEISLHALYSRLGHTPLTDPDSGYPIVPGAGMQQQIGFGGNVDVYVTLTAGLIEAFFDRIVYSRIAPGKLGDVIGYSGQYGMKEFAKALDKWADGKAIVRQSSTHDNRKDPSGIHNNSLRAGYSYTMYDLPTGGSFKLVHNPLNDDKSIHRDIDKLNGKPLESQRISILDITGGNGNSINIKDNIKLVRKNKVHGVTIIEGRYGPGGVISKDAKHSGDYYEVHISDSVGMEIEDPTVTGELVKGSVTQIL